MAAISNYSVLLICVYMGKLPFWMPAFLLSCSKNADIQWMIVSDAEPPAILPVNVNFLSVSVEEFNTRASDALNFKISIRPECAYKICDLKIAFGEIFEKEISFFTFWGICDLDIAWGNIRKFITDEILSDYDIVTSRIKRISGHFCLFRNNPQVNSIYRRINNIKQLIQDDKNCATDENHLTDYLDKLHANNIAAHFKNFFSPDQFSPKVYWDRVLTTSGAHQRAIEENSLHGFLWQNGKTFDLDGTSELMYIHFHKMKHSMEKIDFFYPSDVQNFLITRKGFLVT